MEFTNREIKMLKAALGEFEWVVKENLINWGTKGCRINFDSDPGSIVEEIKYLQDKLSIYY